MGTLNNNSEDISTNNHSVVSEDEKTEFLSEMDNVDESIDSVVGKVPFFNSKKRIYFIVFGTVFICVVLSRLFLKNSVMTIKDDVSFIFKLLIYSLYNIFAYVLPIVSGFGFVYTVFYNEKDKVFKVYLYATVIIFILYISYFILSMMFS
jgi:hypothetical protein